MAARIRARQPAAEAGLQVYEAVNVRLGSGRIPIPDVVIVDPIDPRVPVIDVAAVRLVAEIVSSNDPGVDRVLKMKLYAEARIPWYLLVEPWPTSLSLQLFRLEHHNYVLHTPRPCPTSISS